MTNPLQAGVNHAELRRLAEALRVSWSDRGWTPAKKIDGLLKEGRQASDGITALLNEIDALRASPVLPDRGWRDIADHDKSRAPVLLVGRYRDGVTWSDIYHGWWQPEFESADENGDNALMMPGSWARWPHPFPPTHFQVLALPDAPAEGAE